MGPPVVPGGLRTNLDAPICVNPAGRWVYLQLGLSVVLVFVGAKLVYGDLFGKVPIWVLLPFIATVVTASIAVSLWKTRGQGLGAPPGSE